MIVKTVKLIRRKVVIAL